MHPIDQIRQFTTLTPELEKKLRLIMRDKTFAKGETIHSSQMLSTGSFYITKGAARVFYTQGGREHTVSFAFSDQFVLIPHGGYSANSDTMALQFLMPSTAIFLPRMSIKTELEESGALIDLEALLFFNTALLQYTSFLEERVDVLQTLSAPERYEWAIRRFPRLPDCATATQIASFLGITKETLYRIKSGKYADRHTPSQHNQTNTECK